MEGPRRPYPGRPARPSLTPWAACARPNAARFTLSLLKSCPSRSICVLRTDPLFGLSWLAGWESSLGHREALFARTASWLSRTSRCGSNSPCGRPSAAATADGNGPGFLGSAVEAVDELAAFAGGGTAGDRGRLAPPGIYTLLCAFRSS